MNGGAVNAGEVKGRFSLDDDFTAKVIAATSKVTAFGDRWEKVSQRLGAAASATAPMSLAVSALGAGALHASAQFETAMTKTMTIAGETKENLGAMKQAVLSLAPAVGVGPRALADALLSVESTGMAGAQALSVLERAGKASAIGLGVTKDIAKAVTSAITTYGESNLNATEATDKLFAAVKAGGAEANEFAGALGNVLPVAQQMGVKFDQVVGSIATFTRLGVSADEAATGLRATLMSLLNPGDEARKTMKEMGTSIEQVRDKIRKDGLAAALDDLLVRAKGNVDVIGNLIPEARALASVLGTVGSQGKTTKEILEQIAHSTGVVDDAFAEVSKTAGFKWSVFLAKAEVQLIRFGDKIAEIALPLLDAFDPVFQFIEHLLDLFGKLPKAVQVGALAIIGLVAASAPILFFLSSFTELVALASNGLKTLAGWYIKTASAAAVYAEATTVAAVATEAQNKATSTSIGSKVASSAAKYLTPGAKIAARARAFLPIEEAVATGTAGVIGADAGAGVATAAGSAFTVAAGPVAAFAAALGAVMLAGRALFGDWSHVTGPLGQAKEFFGEATKTAKEFANLGLTVVGEAMKVLSDVTGEVVAVAKPFYETFKDIAKLVMPKWLTEFADTIGTLASNLDKLINIRVKGMPLIVYLLGGAVNESVIGKVTELGNLAKGLSGMVSGTPSMPTVSGPTSLQMPSTGLPQVDERKMMDDLNDQLAAKNQKVSVDKAELDRIAKISDKLFNRDTIKDAEDLLKALHGVDNVSKLTTESQLALNESVTRAIEAYKALGKQVPPEMQKVAEVTLKAAVLPKAMADLNEKSVAIATDYLSQMADKASQQTDNRLKDLESALGAAVQVGEQYVNTFGTTLDKSLMAAEKWKTESLRLVKALAGDSTAEFERASQQIKTIYKKMVDDATDLSKGMPTAFITAWSNAGHAITKNVEKASKRASELFDKFREQGLSVEDAFKKAWEEFQRQADQQTLGRALKDTLKSAAVVFPQALAQAILHGQSLWAAVRSVAVQLGSEIGKNIGSDLGQSLTDKFAGKSGVFAKMMGSLGGMMGDLMSAGIGALVELGLKALEKAIKYFGGNATKEVREQFASQKGFENLGDLYAKLGRMGEEGSKLREIGMHVIGTNDTKGNEAWMKQVTEFMDRFTKSLDEASEKLSVFQGKAPAALQPMIAELLKSTELTDSLRKQLESMSGEASWKDIEDAANRYGISLDKLGNKYNQLKSNDVFNQLFMDWTLFSDTNADMGEVFAKMGGQVQEALNRAKKFGIAIPEYMRPMLEAMLKSGELLDENGNALKDLDGFKFSGDIKSSLDQMLDVLKTIKDVLLAIGGPVAEHVVSGFDKIRGHAPTPTSAMPYGDGAFIDDGPVMDSGRGRTTYTGNAAIYIGTQKIGEVAVDELLRQVELNDSNGQPRSVVTRLRTALEVT